jgi:Flp pilus assembly pilin Flp
MSGFLRRVLQLFGDRRGAAAVEFALVVPMLIVIICSTLEAGWIMVQTIMLDRALDQTVRELRVGNLPNPSQQIIRENVCSRALVLHGCVDMIAIEMFPITAQGTGYPSDATRCVDRASPIAPVLRFSQGARSEIMFVRACFVVSPLTPGLGLALALPKDASGAMRIIARAGFVNEPA